MIEEKIWERKYRPKTLDDYVFSNESTKKLFESYVSEGDIPHLLISGIQGTGKSTITEILVNSMLSYSSDIVKINASTESGIDNVRERIVNECQTFPMGDFKVIILEEADGLSHAAQKALRATIDTYGDVVRFIFTANYVNKIIPALSSRTQQIHIDELDDEQILERIAYIIDQEQLEVDNVDFVYNHIDRYKPDMRKIINSIEQSSKDGKLGDVMTGGSGTDFLEQWQNEWAGTPDFDTLFELAINTDQHNFEQAYTVMYNNSNKLDNELQAITTIADFLYKAQVVASQEIMMKACLIELFGKLE